MKYYKLLMIILFLTPSLGWSQPTEMDMFITVNRIYNINSVEQTYNIDGYLVSEWNDSQQINNISNLKPVYENDHIDELEKLGIRIPKFEFVNIVSNRYCENKRVMIGENGNISYQQRFMGTFISQMDFRKFPFDTQVFKIDIEPYIYNKSQLIFRKTSITVSQEDNPTMAEWALISHSAATGADTHYGNLGSNSSGDFAHLTATLTYRRNPDYYLWRFILPLSLILISSWSVFWLKSFNARLSTSFTMMLTVVAYTFYTSSLLPRLPYTTFIERLVIMGYVSIFAMEVIFVLVELMNRLGKNLEKWVIHCRWAFPMIFLAAVTILIFDEL